MTHRYGLRWIGAWGSVLAVAGLLLYVGVAVWVVRKGRESDRRKGQPQSS